MRGVDEKLIGETLVGTEDLQEPHTFTETITGRLCARFPH